MRVLSTCWPLEGHPLPQMAIATALRTEATPLPSTRERERGRSSRAKDSPSCLFWHVLKGRELGAKSPGQDLSSRGRSLRAMHRACRTWVVKSVSDQVADLRPIMEDWQPAVLVSVPMMWAPPVILWEVTPIPIALSSPFMEPLLPGPDAPRVMGLPRAQTGIGRLLARLLGLATDIVASALHRRVSELRAAHGLAPIRGPVTALLRAPPRLPGRQPPRRRLQPARPSGHGLLRRPLHLASPYRGEPGASR